MDQTDVGFEEPSHSKHHGRPLNARCVRHTSKLRMIAMVTYGSEFKNMDGTGSCRHVVILEST
jgi:hypothetical protein